MPSEGLCGILSDLRRSLKFYGARRGSERAARRFTVSHRRLLSLGSKKKKRRQFIFIPAICLPLTKGQTSSVGDMCRSVDPLRGTSSSSGQGTGLSLLPLLPSCPFTHHWCLISATEVIYYWERRAAGAGTRVGAAQPSRAAAARGSASHLEIQEMTEKLLYRQRGHGCGSADF